MLQFDHISRDRSLRVVLESKSLRFLDFVKVVLDGNEVEIADDAINEVLEVLPKHACNRYQPPKLCKMLVFELQRRLELLQQTVLNLQLPLLLESQQPANALFSDLSGHLTAEGLRWIALVDSCDEYATHLLDRRHVAFYAASEEPLWRYAPIALFDEIEVANEATEDFQLALLVEFEHSQQFDEVAEEDAMVH